MKCTKLKAEHATLLSLWFLVCSYLYFYIKSDFPFNDTDDYMRLVTVLDYIEGAGWYDHIMKRCNFPFGGDMHWTRLYDCILLAGTYIFSVFSSSLKEALFHWGTVVTPILSCFSILYFFSVCRHFLSKEVSFLSTIFFFLNPFILSQIRPFRPDHHAFLILMALITIKCCIDVVKTLQDKNVDYKACFKLGLAYSLSIVASPELLIVIFPIELFFVMFWCRFKINTDAVVTKSIFWFITMIACYLLFSSDNYHGVSSVEYDKISIVHVCIAASSLLLWISLKVIGQYTIQQNVISLACSGIPIALLLYICFPDIIYLMSGKISPELKRVWLYNISEMQSPLARGVFSYASMLYIAYSLCTLAGMYTVFSKLHLFKIRHQFLIMYVGVITVLYGIFGGISYRTAYYYSILSVPFLSIFFTYSSILGFIKSSIRKRMTLIIFPIAIYIIPMILSESPEKKQAPINDKQLITFLNNLSEPCSILIDEKYGPKILYYTKHNVVSAPYHRHEYGILSNYKVFHSKDATFDDLKYVIDTSNIAYIIVSKEDNLTTSAVCKKLSDGDLPSYLEKVEVDIENAIVFKVVRYS